MSVHPEKMVLISACGLGKRYQIGQSPIGAAGFGAGLQHIARLFSAKGRAEQLAVDAKRTLWALKGVSFDIRQGERVGIIGNNGAGKSTLLKILSRVTYPTEGEARIRGRLTSLLEVGTGFSDALTGRENVYLNASFHGLSRDEINGRFEDIVAFAELERFIDTPIRFYSTGMRSRLAFAVAAHLDPDALLLDEVLAVGDLGFQRKCLERMEHLTGEGRTLLFVSHSMDSIIRYCDRCLWLEKGELVMDGLARDVTEEYVKRSLGLRSAFSAPQDNLVEAPRLFRASIVDASGVECVMTPVDEAVAVEVEFEGAADRAVFPVLQLSRQDVPALVAIPDDESLKSVIGRGPHALRLVLPPHILNTGHYDVQICLATAEQIIAQQDHAIAFQSVEARELEGSARGPLPRDFPGVLRPRLEWQIERIGQVDAPDSVGPGEQVKFGGARVVYVRDGADRDNRPIVQFDFDVLEESVSVPSLAVAFSGCPVLFWSVPPGASLEKFRFRPGRYRVQCKLPEWRWTQQSAVVTISAVEPQFSPMFRHFLIEGAVTVNLGASPSSRVGTDGDVPVVFEVAAETIGSQIGAPAQAVSSRRS